MSKQLTLKERYHIWFLYKSGKSSGHISRETKRHKTTISRELKRNKSPGGYDPEKANLKYSWVNYNKICDYLCVPDNNYTKKII